MSSGEYFWSVGLPFSHTVTIENLQNIPLRDLNTSRQVKYGQSKCYGIVFNKTSLIRKFPDRLSEIP